MASGDCVNLAPLHVQECRVYRGPNLYSHGTVIRVRVQLGTLEEWPSDRLPDFTDNLLALMPTLEEHRCSYGEHGGFVRRLREGTWLAHVVEHIAIELQRLAGHSVTFGKTRSVRGEPQGTYDIVYSYEAESVGVAAGLLALRLVQSLLPFCLRGLEGAARFGIPGARPVTAESLAAPLDFAAEIEALKRTARRAGLGPSTQSLADEARRRGIPVQRLDEMSLLQLGYGCYMKTLRASVTGNTPLIACETAKDKALTSQLLRMIGVPVPDDRTAQTADEAVRAARQLGFPVVVKPRDGNHGRGVSLNLKDDDSVRRAFGEASQHSRSVIVERFFAGNDYRVLVVGGRVVAAAHRLPAHVTGDGRSTITQLVEVVNSDPRRGEGHENVLTRIRLDAAALRLLSARGYTTDSVPPDGEIVFLQETANLSTGGTAADILDSVPPDNIDLFERAARRIGLDVAGLDVVSPDLSRPLSEVGGASSK
jgi:cyanophycin synthetase